MGLKVKDNVDVRDAESDETIRTPDGGFANVPAGDKVYTTEAGWVYHHSGDETPDWDEVKSSHSNPALIEDLLEDSSGDEDQAEDEDSDEDSDEGTGLDGFGPDDGDEAPPEASPATRAQRRR